MGERFLLKALGCAGTGQIAEVIDWMFLEPFLALNEVRWESRRSCSLLLWRPPGTTTQPPLAAGRPFLLYDDSTVELEFGIIGILSLGMIVHVDPLSLRYSAVKGRPACDHAQRFNPGRDQG